MLYFYLDLFRSRWFRIDYNGLNTPVIIHYNRSYWIWLCSLQRNMSTKPSLFALSGRYFSNFVNNIYLWKELMVKINNCQNSNLKNLFIIKACQLRLNTLYEGIKECKNIAIPKEVLLEIEDLNNLIKSKYEVLRFKNLYLRDENKKIILALNDLDLLEKKLVSYAYNEESLVIDEEITKIEEKNMMEIQKYEEIINKIKANILVKKNRLKLSDIELNNLDKALEDGRIKKVRYNKKHRVISKSYRDLAKVIKQLENRLIIVSNEIE